MSNWLRSPYGYTTSLSPHGWYPIIAATVFVIAAFTDWLDGHVARTTNQITRLGQLLDPIADKLLVMATLVSLVGRQQVPAWVVVIILCRELAVTGLRALAADRHIVISAEAFGKYKMVFLIVGSLLLVLNLPRLALPGMICLYIGMILGVVSPAICGVFWPRTMPENMPCVAIMVCHPTLKPGATSNASWPSMAARRHHEKSIAIAPQMAVYYLPTSHVKQILTRGPGSKHNRNECPWFLRNQTLQLLRVHTR